MSTEEEKRDRKERQKVHINAGGLESRAERPSRLKEVLGRCFMCKNLNYAESQYGKVFAKCWTFDIQLRSGDPIIECSSYEDKSLLSLRDMLNMATYVEVDGHTRQAGFMADWEAE